MMLIIPSVTCLIVCSGPVVLAVSFWACNAMLVVATTFAMTILLLSSSCPTQLLFYAALEKMTAEYPPAKNSDLGRERGIPESIDMMQDGLYLVEAAKVVESKVLSWGANFGIRQLIGLGMG